MDATITLGELIKFILFLLAIGIGIVIIIAIKNLADILKKVNRIVGDNEDSIDSILRSAPTILESVDKISAELSETIEELSPSITNIVKNADEISGDVAETIDKVTYTTDIVSDSIEDTIDLLNNNKNTIVGYLNIILEVAGVLKKVFTKK